MKKTITIIFTFISILTFGQTKDKYQKHFDSLMFIGHFDELIIFFEKELKKYPKSEDILRSLGYVHIAKNNLDLGEKYYAEAVVVNPKCARCYSNIGKVYSLKGDNKKALEYFDKSINTDPKDALLYSNRARFKEMSGDKFGALSDHNKAIEIEPNNFDNYVQRGLYNANSGYQSLAISDLTKAIELSPKNFYPYFQRSNIYYRQKRLIEALHDVNKAIELDSNQYSLFTSRGEIFDMMQEPQKAINDYNKAISLNKNDFLPYLNRATIFYKLEDLDASCSDYFMVKSLIQGGKVTDQGAIEEINGAIKDICDSSKPSYYYQRGVGYYNLKEYQKAIDKYSEGLKKFPENAMMLAFKGNAYLALNQYQQAIENYNLSLKYKENYLAEIKSNPRFADTSAEKTTSFYNGSLASVYFSLSECNINLGHHDEALTQINKAIELAPDIKEFNKESYYNIRGYINLIVGEYANALNDFNKSIQTNKDFPLAYVNRAIAKVSTAEKVKISTFYIRGNINYKPMSVTWNSPSKSSLKKSEANILSALADCNTAIKIDNKLGFAYYIRGQIKQMLIFGDYCQDLLNAKELGLTVELELLKNCGK